MSKTFPQQPNWTMIKQLAAKDWYFTRAPLIAYLIVGLIATLMLTVPGSTSFLFGAVLLISAVNIAGIHLAVATILNERKNQNLAFVMSLPVSYLDYTLAKMLINVGVFLVFWLTLATSIFALVLSKDTLNDGMLPFLAIGLLELLIAFLLLFAIALVTESEIFTVVFMTVASISISLFWHITASVDAIGSQMQGNQIDWNATVLTFIAVEVIFSVFIIIGAFYMQSRKTDFL